MRRWHFVIAATLIVLAGSVSMARALVIAPPAGPARVINADAVIVGKVVGLEPQDVMVMNVTYRVAIVKVDQALKGKEAKQVRIAFIPPPANPPKFKIGGGRGGVQLAEGNAGLMILKKHA